MRVLVTGAGGFIGSHVVAALARRGADPVGLVRHASDRSAALGVEVVEADYRDPRAIERALDASSARALVHAAWRLAPGSAYLHDAANVGELESSLRLFTTAERAGCTRIVGIGTCLEYATSNEAVSEDAPLRPATLYAASKAALFLTSQAWASEVGVSFAWPRLYYPFGPREAPTRLIPTVVNALLRGERVATTEGLQQRSFLFVEDVADAIAAITLSGSEGAFNVGSPATTSVRELVEQLASRVGRTDLLDIGAFPARPDDPSMLWPDTRRLSALGWQPSVARDEALARTIDWWRANPVGPR